VTIEVQCTSCHTRYRIDEQVLPEGTPTFKCSRCGHVFTIDPRGATRTEEPAEPSAAAAPRAPRARRAARDAAALPAVGEKSMPDFHAGWVGGAGAADSLPVKDPASTSKHDENEGAATDDPAQVKAKPSTDDLLSKPFRDDGSPSGESLRFDFNDDRREREAPASNDIAHDRDSGDWQVGESDRETAGEATMAERAKAFSTSDARNEDPAPPPNARRKAARPAKSSKPDEQVEFVDEDAAPIYNRSGVTHSARFFVALFALVAIGYGAMTMMIRSAPATAAEMLSHLPQVGERFILPIAPARMVAMRDVHGDYVGTKGGHAALVVTGIAENVSGSALHAVQIAASLRDAAQRPLANRAVYCGNSLSAAMVAQMTPHELEFFQKLDPPRAFTLEPSATTPFVIVFIDPPTAVSRFDVSVASATRSAPLAASTNG
jgi:predicted Zn finger-like uncharacterized protein